MQANTELSLAAVIGITECVKAVVWSAHRINLLALNALLLSRKSGSEAVGFAVVSTELRAFSQQLSQQMARLHQLSAASLDQISAALKRRHLQQLLARANGDGRLSLQQPLARMATAEQAFSEEAAGRGKQLGVVLEDANQHCLYGDVIARFAKIEAAYGGALRGHLGEIASEFTALVADVLPEIERLRRMSARSSR
ncbi:MAG: hypothetical protein II007_14305 [Gammaproteobacteria bacterium]|nr:hypothetical protein [Gammaproteobacteria bacterium]